MVPFTEISSTPLSWRRIANVLIERKCGSCWITGNPVVTRQTGYPFDSGYPNRLWVGLFPFDGRVHNLPICRWLDCDSLLREAVEKFASAARFATVEAELEFV